MTTEKPEALRLADELELLQTPPTALAAIELRRLHAVETMAHLARAGHEQWFAECQRLHAEVQRLSAPPMRHVGECAHDAISRDVCEGMYADRLNDNMALCEALRAVYALAGQDKNIAKIVHDAIREHGALGENT